MAEGEVEARRNARRLATPHRILPSSPKLPGGATPDAPDTADTVGAAPARRRLDVVAQEIAGRIGMPGLATHTVIAAMLVLLTAAAAGGFMALNAGADGSSLPTIVAAPCPPTTTLPEGVAVAQSTPEPVSCTTAPVGGQDTSPADPKVELPVADAAPSSTAVSTDLSTTAPGAPELTTAAPSAQPTTTAAPHVVETEVVLDRPAPSGTPDRHRAVRHHRQDRKGPATPQAAAPRASTTPDPAIFGPITATTVPNFLIDRFRIPPFLLPIYQAAGIEYGVRWEVLAAINSIETDYGRNLNVSSAGAVGWMQFMPETWDTYGVDANRDGSKDPYNPVDAIFAAARYLKAADAAKSLWRAIYAYNHADWYVADVLRRAATISSLPPAVLGSLTGLTLGRFPVASTGSYAGRLRAASVGRKPRGGNATIAVTGSSTRRGTRIYARSGSAVIAVQDGRVLALGRNRKLGRFVRLRDTFGNTYTYAHLGKVARRYPVARPRRESEAQIRRELGLDGADPKPVRAASSGHRLRGRAAAAAARRAFLPVVKTRVRPRRTAGTLFGPEAFAYVNRRSVATAAEPSPHGLSGYFVGEFGLRSSEVVLHRLRRGSRVIAGTVLGRIGRTSLRFRSSRDRADRRAARAAAARLHTSRVPHVLFEIRPAGRHAPTIDPKPILDGWRLLDTTDIYRAANPLVDDSPSGELSIGQIMLMSKEQLQSHVLDSADIQIYGCGRRDIRAGVIDRRVLAALEFLVARGMKPTVTSLQCGHGFYTAGGNVSEHSSGNAVDIAAINGVPIVGHQGRGSITDKAVRQLLTLQGTAKPHQIITLMQYNGTDNTYAMADHYDHIHLGFRPGDGGADSALSARGWDRLVSRLGQIQNPVVPTRPSRYSVKVEREASTARRH